MDRIERINEWKQDVMEDITILQRRIGVKNEEIERLKAEFLVENDSIKSSELKNKLYEAVDKHRIPSITLNVAAVRVNKQGEMYNSFPTFRIDNLLYDTAVIKEAERFCTKKSKKQIRFYMEKGRAKHRGYETIAIKDVTEEVNSLLQDYSFHTAYEIREKEIGVINDE